MDRARAPVLIGDAARAQSDGRANPSRPEYPTWISSLRVRPIWWRCPGTFRMIGSLRAGFFIRLSQNVTPLSSNEPAGLAARRELRTACDQKRGAVSRAW